MDYSTTVCLGSFITVALFVLYHKFPAIVASIKRATNKLFRIVFFWLLWINRKLYNHYTSDIILEYEWLMYEQKEHIKNLQMVLDKRAKKTRDGQILLPVDNVPKANGQKAEWYNAKGETITVNHAELSRSLTGQMKIRRHYGYRNGKGQFKELTKEIWINDSEFCDEWRMDKKREYYLQDPDGYYTRDEELALVKVN